MILLVDVGNTESVIGAGHADHLLARWRIPTQAGITPDSLAVSLASLFSLKGLALSDVDHAVLAAVVPQVVEAWKEAFASLRIPVSVAGHGCDANLAYECTRPAEIGPDRIANAVGAIAHYGSPAIVVDYGTATNIDVINSQGAYVGGTIAPGIGISSDALFSRAARLASIPLTRPDHVIGSSTSQAVQSGILWGALAQTEGMVALIKQELGLPLDAAQTADTQAAAIPVIATGGYAHLVAPYCACFSAIDPDLTLKGLYEIGKHAQKSC